MATANPVDPYTQQYRVNLASQGIDTSELTDDRITFLLGQRVEKEGQLPEQVYGRAFADRYYAVKHTPDPDMQGWTGILKEPVRAARMAGLGLMGSVTSDLALKAGYVSPEAEDWLMSRANEMSRAASAETPSIVSPSEINWSDPESIARGAGSAIGQTVPSLVYMLGAGKVSKDAGKALGRVASKRIPDNARVTKNINGLPQNLSKREYIESQFERIGAITGVGMSSLGMNTGEIYQNLYPNTQLPEDHEDYISTKDAKAWSMAGGALAGGLDMVMPVKILQKFMAQGGKPAVNYWHRFINSLPTNVIFEGGTEAGQEFILKMAERYAKGEETTWDSFTPQERKHLLDAGILGSVGGVGGTLVEAMHEGPPPVASDKEMDLLRQQQKQDRANLESRLKTQREFLNKQDDRVFKYGEEIQDVESGVRGRMASADDKFVVLDVNGKMVTIPRYNAARTEGYAEIKIGKGDYVEFNDGTVKFKGYVRSVSDDKVFIGKRKYALSASNVTVLKTRQDQRMQKSLEKANRGAGVLSKEDTENILRDSGFTGNVFIGKDLTKDAAEALGKIEFSEGDTRWTYQKKNKRVTRRKRNVVDEANKKVAEEIITDGDYEDRFLNDLAAERQAEGATAESARLAARSSLFDVHLAGDDFNDSIRNLVYRAIIKKHKDSIDSETPQDTLNREKKEKEQQDIRDAKQRKLDAKEKLKPYKGGVLMTPSGYVTQRGDTLVPTFVGRMNDDLQVDLFSLDINGNLVVEQKDIDDLQEFKKLDDSNTELDEEISRLYDALQADNSPSATYTQKSYANSVPMKRLRPKDERDNELQKRLDEWYGFSSLDDLVKKPNKKRKASSIKKGIEGSNKQKRVLDVVDAKGIGRELGRKLERLSVPKADDKSKGTGRHVLLYKYKDKTTDKYVYIDAPTGVEGNIEEAKPKLGQGWTFIRASKKKVNRTEFDTFMDMYKSGEQLTEGEITPEIYAQFKAGQYQLTEANYRWGLELWAKAAQRGFTVESIYTEDLTQRIYAALDNAPDNLKDEVLAKYEEAPATPSSEDTPPPPSSDTPPTPPTVTPSRIQELEEIGSDLKGWLMTFDDEKLHLVPILQLDSDGKPIVTDALTENYPNAKFYFLNNPSVIQAALSGLGQRLEDNFQNPDPSIIAIDPTDPNNPVISRGIEILNLTEGVEPLVPQLFSTGKGEQIDREQRVKDLREENKVLEADIAKLFDGLNDISSVLNPELIGKVFKLLWNDVQIFWLNLINDLGAREIQQTTREQLVENTLAHLRSRYTDPKILELIERYGKEAVMAALIQPNFNADSDIKELLFQLGKRANERNDYMTETNAAYLYDALVEQASTTIKAALDVSDTVSTASEDDLISFITDSIESLTRGEMGEALRSVGISAGLSEQAMENVITYDYTDIYRSLLDGTFGQVFESLRRKFILRYGQASDTDIASAIETFESAQFEDPTFFIGQPQKHFNNSEGNPYHKELDWGTISGESTLDSVAPDPIVTYEENADGTRRQVTRGITLGEMIDMYSQNKPAGNISIWYTNIIRRTLEAKRNSQLDVGKIPAADQEVRQQKLDYKNSLESEHAIKRKEKDNLSSVFERQLSLLTSEGVIRSARKAHERKIESVNLDLARLDGEIEKVKSEIYAIESRYLSRQAEYFDFAALLNLTDSGLEAALSADTKGTVTKIISLARNVSIPARVRLRVPVATGVTAEHEDIKNTIIQQTRHLKRLESMKIGRSVNKQKVSADNFGVSEVELDIAIRQLKTDIALLESEIPKSVRNGGELPLLTGPDGNIDINPDILSAVKLPANGPSAQDILKAIASTVLSDADSMGKNNYDGSAETGVGIKSNGPYKKHALVIEKDAYGRSTGVTRLVGLYRNQETRIVPQLITDEDGNVIGVAPKPPENRTNEFGDPLKNLYRDEGLADKEFVGFNREMTKAFYKDESGATKEYGTSYFSSYSRLFIHPRWLSQDTSRGKQQGMPLIDFLLDPTVRKDGIVRKFEFTGETVVFYKPPTERSGDALPIAFKNPSAYHKAKSRALSDTDGNPVFQLGAGKRRQTQLIKLRQMRLERDKYLSGIGNQDPDATGIELTKQIEEIEKKHNPRITNKNVTSKDGSNSATAVASRIRANQNARNKLTDRVLNINKGISIGDLRYTTSEIVDALEPAYAIENEITELYAQLFWASRNESVVDSDILQRIQTLEDQWNELYEARGSKLKEIIDNFIVRNGSSAYTIYSSNKNYGGRKGKKAFNWADFPHDVANYIIESLYGNIRLTMSTKYELSAMDKLSTIGRHVGLSITGRKQRRNRPDSSFLERYMNELAEHQEIDTEYKGADSSPNTAAESNLYDITELVIPAAAGESIETISRTYGESDIQSVLDLNMDLIRSLGFKGVTSSPEGYTEALSILNSHISSGSENNPALIRVYVKTLRPDRAVAMKTGRRRADGEWAEGKTDGSMVEFMSEDEIISRQINSLSTEELNLIYIQTEQRLDKLRQDGEFSFAGVSSTGERAEVPTLEAFELLVQQDLIMERLRLLQDEKDYIRNKVKSDAGGEKYRQRRLRELEQGREPLELFEWYENDSERTVDIILDRLAGTDWMDGPFKELTEYDLEMVSLASGYDQLAQLIYESAYRDYANTQTSIDTIDASLNALTSEVKDIEVAGTTLQLSRKNQSIPQELEQNAALFKAKLRSATPNVERTRLRKRASIAAKNRAENKLRSTIAYLAVRKAIRDAMQPETGSLWSLMTDATKSLNTAGGVTVSPTESIKASQIAGWQSEIETLEGDRELIINDDSMPEQKKQDALEGIENAQQDLRKKIAVSENDMGEVGLYTKWQLVDYMARTLPIDKSDLRYPTTKGGTKEVGNPWIAMDPYQFHQIFREIESHAVVHLDSMGGIAVDRPVDVMQKLTTNGIESLSKEEREILNNYLNTSTKSIAARNFSAPIDVTPLEAPARLGDKVQEGLRKEIENWTTIFKGRTSPSTGEELLELVGDPHLLEVALRVLTADRYPDTRYSQYVQIEDKNGNLVYIPQAKEGTYSITREQILESPQLIRKRNLVDSIDQIVKFAQDRGIRLSLNELKHAMSKNQGDTSRYLAEIFFSEFDSETVNSDVLSLILTSRNRLEMQTIMEKLWDGTKNEALKELDEAGEKHDNAIAQLNQLTRDAISNWAHKKPSGLTEEQQEIWEDITEGGGIGISNPRFWQKLKDGMSVSRPVKVQPKESKAPRQKYIKNPDPIGKVESSKFDKTELAGLIRITIEAYRNSLQNESKEVSKVKDVDGYIKHLQDIEGVAKDRLSEAVFTDADIENHQRLVDAAVTAAEELEAALEAAIEAEVINNETGLVEDINIGKDYSQITIPKWSSEKGDFYSSAEAFIDDLYAKATDVLSDIASLGADLTLNKETTRNALQGQFSGSPISQASEDAGIKNDPTVETKAWDMSLKNMPLGYKSVWGVGPRDSGLGGIDEPTVSREDLARMEQDLASKELQQWDIPVEQNIQTVLNFLGEGIDPTRPMDATTIILKALEVADDSPRGRDISRVLNQFVYTDSQGNQKILPIFENVKVSFANHAKLRSLMNPAHRGNKLPRGMHQNGQIIISIDGFTDSSTDPTGDLLTTLAHELLHPIFNSLQKSVEGTTMSDSDRTAVLETLAGIRRLYEFVKGKSKSAISLSSLDEFMIDGINDPDFMSELKSIKLPSSMRAELGSSSWVRTAWDFIVDIISRIVSYLTGGRSKNAYTELRTLVDNLFNHYHELGQPVSMGVTEDPQFSEAEQEPVETAGVSKTADDNVTYAKMTQLAGVNEAVKTLAGGLARALEEGYVLKQNKGESPLEAFIRQHGTVDGRNILKVQAALAKYLPSGESMDNLTIDWAENNTDFRMRAAEVALYYLEGIRESARKQGDKGALSIESLTSSIKSLRDQSLPENVFNESKHGATLKGSFTKAITRRIKLLRQSGDDLNLGQLERLKASTKTSELVGILRALVRADVSFGKTKEDAEKAILRATDDTLLADMFAEVLSAKGNKVYISYMQLAEGKVSTDKQKVIDEIKSYKDKTPVQLIRALERLGKKQGIENDVKRNYLNLWLEIRKKEELVERNKSLGETTSLLDEYMLPKTTELRFIVGELEAFDAVDGADIIHMVKSGDEWVRGDSFKLKLNNSLLPADRDAFNKVIASNKEFLRDPDAQRKYKDTPLWEIIANQTEASSILPIGREHTEARKAAFFGWLNGLGQRFATMGSLGKTISQKLNKIMLYHKSHESYFRAAALGWSNAMKDIASQLGYRDYQKFLNGPYSQALGWLESHPELIGNRKVAFERVWEYMREHGDFNDKTLLTASAKRSFINLLEKAYEAAELERDTSKYFGNKVASEYGKQKVMVQSMVTGEMTQLYRDPILTGPLMVSRRLNRHSKHVAEAILRGWNKVDDIEDDEELMAYYSKYITEDVASDFIAPYATSPAAVEIFNADKDVPVSQSFSAEAWRSASGVGAEKFLNWTLALSEEYDVSHADMSRRAFGRLRGLRSDLIKAHKNADGNDLIKVADSLSHTLMDARDIESAIPREFFQYNMYDEVSMNIQLATIIGNAVMGRGGAGMQAMHESLMDELEEKRVRFGEVIKQAGGTINESSYKPKYKYSRAIVKRAEQIFRDLGYKDGRKAYISHLAASKQVQEATNALSAMEQYFGGKDGPYQDVRLLTESLGTLAFLILSNPASSFLNFLSIPDIFMFSKGFNAMGVKGTGAAVLNVIDQMFGGFVEGAGINLAKSHRYSQDTGEMFYHFKENELPWREAANYVGIRGSKNASMTDMLVTGQKSMKARAKSGQGVVGGTRQPITLRTMLPVVGDPFGHVGRVVNHSIGFGLSAVYHDLVKEAADFIVDNKLARSVTLTSKDLGYGRDGLAKLIDGAFFGVEAGWNNYNNKLEDSGIGSITSLAWDYLDRKLQGDKRVLTKDTNMAIALLGMNEVSLDGFLARPSWMYTNGIARAASPLLGWATAKMNMVNNFLVDDTTGKFSPIYLLKYLFLMSAVHSPIGLVASMVRDNWDEDITGKPNALPKITPTMAIPVVGLFINKDDPNYHPLAALERLGRTTSPYGLAYDFVVSSIAKADPTAYSRGISLDRRIMLTSMIHGFHDSFTTYVGQGGKADWSSVGRPLAYAAGGNSFFHYYHAFSNLMGHESEERAIADMIGMRNMLRQGAKTTGVELKRVAGMGAYQSTELSMHIKAMERATYRRDNYAFQKAYAKAIDAAIRAGKADPKKYVLARFKDRSPRRSVTARTVQDREWRKMLGALEYEERKMIQDYEQSRQYYISRYLEQGGYETKRTRPRSYAEQRRALIRQMQF